jgi:hypothetical protein
MEERQINTEPITERQKGFLIHHLIRWSIKGNLEDLNKLDKTAASYVLESFEKNQIDSALGQLKHLGINVEATEETYL